MPKTRGILTILSVKVVMVGWVFLAMVSTIHWKIANAVAAFTLATRSYSILDRLANAISLDAVDKAIYELGRNLEVIIRNPKDDQSIISGDDGIEIRGKWDHKSRKFKLTGKLPDEPAFSAFLEEAKENIRVARHTAAYAAGLVSSQVSRSERGG